LDVFLTTFDPKMFYLSQKVDNFGKK
jgi:hypothetical protein